MRKLCVSYFAFSQNFGAIYSTGKRIMQKPYEGYIFSWRCPKWSWLVEFGEIKAVFCIQTCTFIGGQINQEVIKDRNKHKVIKLYAIRQSD